VLPIVREIEPSGVTGHRAVAVALNARACEPRVDAMACNNGISLRRGPLNEPAVALSQPVGATFTVAETGRSISRC